VLQRRDSRFICVAFDIIALKHTLLGPVLAGKAPTRKSKISPSDGFNRAPHELQSWKKRHASVGIGSSER
jgi:hypothetical protein